MNIGQLKEKIKDLPDTMEVFIGERVTEFAYGLVNTGEVRNIRFHYADDAEEDEEGEDPSVLEDVFVLTEE
ncbi:hypothetical protein U9K52_09855 [Chryseobacterium sp. MHB01]|uniref:hypothetical protein n=1 Tax=Chryseobacterium sp. MHB01 TaxID=3109433 RepID=UPI002AFDCD97|nr:hypothetical protein [Chryseobacterium sp. MHB01]MEA1849216.1 hypothetical protein [Chryseobacterium sp. MHB01]